MQLGLVPAALVPWGRPDPFFSFTEFLLYPTGPSGSLVFRDLSKNKAALTVVGNAAVATGANSLGPGYLALDGTGDNITAPHSTNYDVFRTIEAVASRCTIEAWVMTTVTNELNFILSTRGIANSTYGWYMYMSATGKLTFTGQSLSLVGTTTMTANVLTHVALDSNGTTSRLLLNGEVQATGTAGAVEASNDGLLYVGSSSVEDGTRDWKGGVIAARLTAGRSRYPGPFNPHETFPLPWFAQRGLFRDRR